MKKLNKKELNQKILKKKGRAINIDAHKVAPANTFKNKKKYTRKEKYKKDYNLD